ncbi:MAG TPA: hypothetical protein VFK36_01950 [Gemmatimonadales bacterium]|nr:hypothetical protein [Gemmatimonadales bacterium]
MTHAADTSTSIPDARHIVAQSLGVLLPPVAMLAGMQAGYAVVDKLCRSGTNPGSSLHVVRVVTLLVVLGAGVMAWRQLHSVGVHEPGNAGDRTSRVRLLGWLGIASAVLFAVVVIAQWLPVFFLDMCT